MDKMTNASGFVEYNVGDSDERPWGSYKVTALGSNDKNEEYCEKEIIVNSGQILSLQSHRHRRERWTVTQGVLTVVLNDRRIELDAGESIDIPLGALHCMANLEQTPCIVHERQEGVCREEDIIRYVDSYGRGTETTGDGPIAESIALYTKISHEIRDGVVTR